MTPMKLIQPLLKPSQCNGCALNEMGEGFSRPSLSTHTEPYHVALVGDALDEIDVNYGLPFHGNAGFKLTRLIEWAGLERERFDVWNTVWCRPPENKLEKEWYEGAAIQHCRTAHWELLLDRVSVVVPMGNVPLGAFTGRKGILKTRGYVQPGPSHTHLVPTVHPSFIQRGQSKYSAAFIHDLQKAVELARHGLQLERTSYLIDPLPLAAYNWAKQYRAQLERDPTTLLAYDIETPGKGEDEGAIEDDDPTYFIWRIGFSYRPGHALTIPWTAPYLSTIRLLLESPGEKVVWNAGFDNPRIRYNGCDIRGTIHDGMIAWHILHSDLPKGLGFVATFTCPYQPAWKHLSHSHPGFYNCTDADVELKSFIAIREELQRSGLWEVYQEDVLDLEPVLIHMHDVGMPLNHAVRETHAQELAIRQTRVVADMITVYPLEARKIAHVYKTRPKCLDGLMERPTTVSRNYCSTCGCAGPKKDHFKEFKRKRNPCGGAGIVVQSEPGVEYYRLSEFKPSRTQLITYQEFLGRPVPTTYDSKTKGRRQTMDEKAIKRLMLKYPDDKLYPLVLEYRELDKIGGTYIGRPVNVDADAPGSAASIDPIESE